MIAIRPRLIHFALATALVAIVALLPAITSSSEYQLSQLEYIIALVILTVSLNITTGFAGQLTLGPAAAFAVSGYTVAVLAMHYSALGGLAAMLVIGAVVGGVSGLIIGLPSFRVSGFYLAMITLFAALFVPTIASQLSLTGASSGLSLLADINFSQRWNGWTLYEITLAIAVAVVVGSWTLLDSRVGRRFATIRTSDELASSLGVSRFRTKLLSFWIGSMVAGVAGAIYVYTQQFFSPDSSSPSLAIYLFAACIVGGLGTVWGPVVGGALIFGLDQFLGGFAEYQGVIFGGILLIFVIGLPKGFVGFVGDAIHAYARRVDPSADFRAEDKATDSPSRSAVPAPRQSEEPPVAPVRLTVRAASRSYGGVRAVDDVDLVIRPGAVHGLVGSNGSGKTTMLNLISGFSRLDTGEVALGDRRLTNLAPHEIARLGIARTFQTPKLTGTSTVLQNLVAAADATRRARGLDLMSVLSLPAGRRWDRAARQRARAALEEVGISKWADQLASQVPHGTRRLVEVARVILLQPSFVLLDEPAAGVSPTELALLAEAIRALVVKGAGVLLIEHNIPFVLELASEITVLHQGRRLASGPPSLLRDRAVSSVFLGEQFDATARP